nr:chorismate mutase [uncultured Fusobacterium sp.]
MIELNLLRKKIDEIDDKLLILLKERLEVSKKIGEIKKKNNMPIYDPVREQEIIEMSIKDFSDEEKIHAVRFLRTLMHISKEVQSKK